MRCNVWHLHPVDIIVPSNHMIESVLPVHCHKWHSIIIVKQKSANILIINLAKLSDWGMPL